MSSYLQNHAEHREVLVFASYCGGDNPACDENKPCPVCLGMSNVFRVPWAAAEYVRELAPEWNATPPVAEETAATIASLTAERDEAQKRASYLQLQAQGWSCEARSQKATVHECYQAATGATGEPGNWNGAIPVRNALAEKDVTIARLESALAVAREALTPSGETKAAYIGEFKFSVTEWVEDDEGDMVERSHDVPVPWTTIKEIMAAILKRANIDAALKGAHPAQGGDNVG